MEEVASEGAQPETPVSQLDRSSMTEQNLPGTLSAARLLPFCPARSPCFLPWAAAGTGLLPHFLVLQSCSCKSLSLPQKSTVMTMAVAEVVAEAAAAAGASGAQRRPGVRVAPVAAGGNGCWACCSPGCCSWGCSLALSLWVRGGSSRRPTGPSAQTGDHPCRHPHYCGHRNEAPRRHQAKVRCLADSQVAKLGLWQL